MAQRTLNPVTPQQAQEICRAVVENYRGGRHRDSDGNTFQIRYPQPVVEEATNAIVGLTTESAINVIVEKLEGKGVREIVGEYRTT